MSMRANTPSPRREIGSFSSPAACLGAAAAGTFFARSGYRVRLGGVGPEHAGLQGTSKWTLGSEGKDNATKEPT